MKNCKVIIGVYKFIWILFILYLLFLVTFVALKFDISLGPRTAISVMQQHREYIQRQRADGIPNFDFIPFQTILWLLKNFHLSSVRLDLFGSILCYLPAGILLPSLLLPYQYTSLRITAQTLLFSFIIIVSIETIQYFSLLGVFHIDDIILGMTGALSGYIIYLTGRQFTKRFFGVNQKLSE